LYEVVSAALACTQGDGASEILVFSFANCNHFSGKKHYKRWYQRLCCIKKDDGASEMFLMLVCTNPNPTISQNAGKTSLATCLCGVMDYNQLGFLRQYVQDVEAQEK
jgi:hypothetical protein